MSISESLDRLSDDAGRFRMVAVDQRTPLIRSLAAADAGRVPDASRVVAVKKALTQALAPSATGMLFDPVWCYPDCLEALAPDQGFMLALEHHDYRQDDNGGRTAFPLEGWSVERIRRSGASGVKLLIYDRPDAAEAVRRHQLRFARETGEACAAASIPFLLELVQYPLGAERDGGVYAEHGGKRPEHVIESLRAYSGPEFHVDLYKLESPLPAASLPDPDGPDAAAAQRWFDAMAKACPGPFVMLSAGASVEAFLRVLTYAYRAGGSGFLAGRAIWGEAIALHPDLGRMQPALAERCLANLDRASELTERLAHPWRKVRGKAA